MKNITLEDIIQKNCEDCENGYCGFLEEKVKCEEIVECSIVKEAERQLAKLKEEQKMKNRYYEKDGTMNEEVFVKRLEQIHDEVDGADLNKLLSIRNKLCALKRKYEQCGRRFLECEYEIIAVNEIIAECK